MEWFNFLAQNWDFLTGIIIAIFGIIGGVKYLSQEKLLAVLQVIGQIIEMIEKRQEPVTKETVLDKLETEAKRDDNVFKVYKKINKSVEKNEDIINKVIIARNLAKDVGETINDARTLAKWTKAIWKGVKRIL